MQRTVATAVVLASLTLGCAPPKAPASLDALTTFLFREWGDTSPEPMQSGVANLQAFLAPLAAKGDLNGDVSNREWQPNALETSDLTGIAWPPKANPQNMVGAAVAWKSPWSITDHARLQLQANQLPAEPTATRYNRTFLTPDPTCFLNQSCLVLNTSNDVIRSNPLGKVELPLQKSFRWVQLITPAGTTWAMVARSWIPTSASGSGGTIVQSAAVDVWLGISSTETWRYQASFSQSTPTLLTSIVAAILVSGVDENLQGDDKAIQQLFHLSAAFSPLRQTGIGRPSSRSAGSGRRLLRRLLVRHGPKTP
jgi:hypothetical protein